MSSQEFEQKAFKIMTRLSSISTKQLSKGDVALSDLVDFHQQIKLSQQDSRKKIKHVHDQIKVLHDRLNQQTESRQNISNQFVASVSKIERAVKTSLNSISKEYQEKQKQIRDKLQQICQKQQNRVLESISETDNLIKQVMTSQAKLQLIQAQLYELRRSRGQIQDRIQRQFSQQVKQMKNIFQHDIRMREGRQATVILKLKQVYKIAMDNIRQQDIERQQSQKMFLTIIQQLVQRITNI